MTSWYHGLEENKIYVLPVREAATITGCVCHCMHIAHIYTLHKSHVHVRQPPDETSRRCLMPQCSVVVYTLNVHYYIFYREYL